MFGNKSIKLNTNLIKVMVSDLKLSVIDASSSKTCDITVGYLERF